jgi:hypothetical protein
MSNLLTTKQIAEFTASGCLFFDSLISDEINIKFLDDIGHTEFDKIDIDKHFENIKLTSSIPRIKAGTPLSKSYPESSPLNKIFNNDVLKGAINSLVGSKCIIDHHFLHLTFPTKYFDTNNSRQMSQPNHQDSTIDPRKTFDIQVFYFPTDVTKDMGGTRYIPGTHLRIVNDTGIARYQNILGQKHIVCKAGTVGIFHHGLWHGAGINFSDHIRYMFKVRLAPTEKQELLWDPEKKYIPLPNRALFWTEESTDITVNDILIKKYPWEDDTHRLEIINRIKMWRLLTGDTDLDIDYWMTRVENERY